MSDWYQQVAGNPIGRLVTTRLGLPQPVRLRRHEPGSPVLPGPALVGAATDGRVADSVVKTLTAADVDVRTTDDAETRYGALLFDATGITDIGSMSQLQAFLSPAFRRLLPSGRLLVLGTPPGRCATVEHAAAQRALDGFVRSAGKEARAGGTANLVYVADGAEAEIESTLRFFCSGRSAYVSGQAVCVEPAAMRTPDDWDRPLAGRVAVVTGAARGIGRSIAEVLARDGAHVVCLDVPAQGEALTGLANALGGEALQLDITDDGAPARLVDHLLERHGGTDVLVHNAGITRDKTLVGMTPDRWASVLTVNLASQVRISAALVARDALRPAGRVVCISSTSGIAGNRGQTNYAASKAGILGLVDAMAPRLGEIPATINAVAPGFIETAMTGSMPIVAREVGRRINSLNQGGLPVDVAETVAWLSQPGTGGVTGQTVRVCGQSWLGA